MDRKDSEDRPPADVEHDLDILRRVAESVTSDRALADDLTQDAWLVLKGRGGSDLRSRATWFRQIVRRLWISRYRSESARRRREAISAKREYEPGALPKHELAELRDAVREELAALNPTYRTTLELRHVEELPIQEIAARQGLPVETVRTRIKRGQAMLRERIERRAGPRAERWLPLLVFVRPSERVSKSSLPATGVFAVVAVSAAIAVLVTLGLGLRGEVHPEAQPADGIASTQPAGPAPESVPSVASTRSALAEPDSIDLGVAAPADWGALAPTGVLPASDAPVAGRVVDEFGSPVGGARVQCLLDGVVHPLAISGEDGGFEIRLPTHVGWVFARAVGYGPSRARSSLDPSITLDRFLELKLETSSEPLQGRVVDSLGAPVQGARVSLTFAHSANLWVLADQPTDRSPDPEPTITAADGSFAIERPEGDPWLLTVESEVGTLRRHVNVRRETREWGLLRLVPYGALEGVVSHPGLTVRVRTALGRIHEGQSDARGRYRIDELDPGTIEVLYHADYQGRQLAAAAILEVEPGRVVVHDPELGEDRGLTGTLLGPEATPLAGWRISAVPEETKSTWPVLRALRSRPGVLETEVDVDGRFSLWPLPPLASGTIAFERPHQGSTGAYVLPMQYARGQGPWSCGSDKERAPFRAVYRPTPKS